MLNYFNEVQNLYFSTYEQGWAQATKLKLDQTLFDKTYSNLTSFFFLLKDFNIQWLSKSKYRSFMTEVNPNNRNEIESDICWWDICESGVIYFFTKKVLKHFNDYWNLNFSVFWLKETQTMEIKQNQIQWSI